MFFGDKAEENGWHGCIRCEVQWESREQWSSLVSRPEARCKGKAWNLEPRSFPWCLLRGSPKMDLLPDRGCQKKHVSISPFNRIFEIKMAVFLSVWFAAWPNLSYFCCCLRKEETTVQAFPYSLAPMLDLGWDTYKAMYLCPRFYWRYCQQKLNYKDFPVARLLVGQVLEWRKYITHILQVPS